MDLGLVARRPSYRSEQNSTFFHKWSTSVSHLPTMKSPTKVARGLSADPQPARVTKAPTPNLVREVLARADNTNTNTVSPELCGFLEGTSAYKCLAGYTCKFNTDLNVVGCCEGDDCLWQTSCCDYNPGPETATWSTFTSECGGLNFDQVGYW